MPMELVAEAKLAALECLPSASKLIYMKAYNQFQKWSTDNQIKCVSEDVMMAYFYHLAKGMKPSSLWAVYSMIKATMRVKKNIDIANFHQLIGFLKSKSSGYKPVKAKVFTEAEIQKFILEASDAEWLDVKVVCIFAVSGALRSDEMVKIEVMDVESHGEGLVIVRIPTSKNKMARLLTIGGGFYPIVQKYKDLRAPGTKCNRFFVNYQKGKCTSQVIDKNKLSAMPRKIATFLQLENVEQYTGHSFRRTSATILANSGASMETIKRHGSWSSSKVAEGYIEDSVHYKKKTGDIITSTITSALDYDQVQVGLDDSLKLETVGQLDNVSEENGNNGFQGKFEVVGFESPDNLVIEKIISETSTTLNDSFNNNRLVGGTVCDVLKSFNYPDMKSCTLNFNFTK